jgi:hypothetical protein
MGLITADGRKKHACEAMKQLLARHPSPMAFRRARFSEWNSL